MVVPGQVDAPALLEKTYTRRGLALHPWLRAALEQAAACLGDLEAVGELLEYVASPEGEARWGERRPVVLEGV